jgi:hypothetical protein
MLRKATSCPVAVIDRVQGAHASAWVVKSGDYDAAQILVKTLSFTGMADRSFWRVERLGARNQGALDMSPNDNSENSNGRREKLERFDDLHRTLSVRFGECVPGPKCWASRTRCFETWRHS